MTNTTTFRAISFSLIAFLTACGSAVENSLGQTGPGVDNARSCEGCDKMDRGSTNSGSAGAAGSTNPIGMNASAGHAGTPSFAGHAGASGAGMSGTAGASAGSSGSAGKPVASCPTLTGVMDLGADSPPSTIITPGLKLGNAGDAGTDLLNMYLGTSVYDPDYRLIGATVCQVDPNGDVADFERVSITWASTEIIAADKPEGDCWKLTPVGGKTPSGLGLDWLSVKVAKPVASSAWHGVPRSGHTPVLHLKDATFAKNDGTCVVTTDGPGLQTEKMVLRASKPSVSLQPIDSQLHDGVDQELFKVAIAGTDTPLAVKHLELTMYDKIAGLWIDNLRLKRGTKFFEPTTYSIKVYAPELYLQEIQPTIKAETTWGSILIDFTDEEIVINSGDVYTLTGTVHAPTKNLAMTLDLRHFAAAKDGVTLTGTLALNPSTFGLSPAQIRISDPSATWGLGEPIQSSFIWSDLSGAPHSAAFGKDGGSSDWINDTLLHKLPIVQTLHN